MIPVPVANPRLEIRHTNIAAIATFLILPLGAADLFPRTLHKGRLFKSRLMIDKTLAMLVGDLKAYLSTPVTTVHRKMDSGRWTLN
jgi:hypothetical protein